MDLKISKKDVMAWLIIIMSAAAFFWRPIFKNEVFLSVEPLYKDYPFRAVVKDARISEYCYEMVIGFPSIHFKNFSFKKGEMPFWNPFILAGTPILGDDGSALFSPFNILYLFIRNFFVAFNYTLMLSLILAGIFMYLFMKTLKVSSFGSLVAAIVFMYNPFFMTFLQLGVQVQAGLWMPLILIAVHKMVEKKSFRWAMMGGGLLWLQLLSGYKQISLYLMAVCLLYFSALIFKTYGRKELRQKLIMVRYVMVLLAVGLGLAAFQLLPIYELARQCYGRGLFAHGTRIPGIPVWHLLTLVLPTYFGNYANFWGKELANMANLQAVWSEMYIYAGLLPLILSLWALARKRDFYTKFFVALAMGILIFLCLGRLQILLLTPIPLINKLFHNRLIFIYGFCIAVLSGIGTEGLFGFGREENKKLVKFARGLAYFWIGAAVLVAGTGLFVVFGEDIFKAWCSNLAHNRLIHLPYHSHHPQYYAEKINYLYRQMGNHYRLDNIEIYLPFIVGATAFLLFFALSRQRRRDFFLKCVLLLIIGLDLFYYGWKWNGTAEAGRVYPETEGIKFLKNQPGIFRITALEKKRRFEEKSHFFVDEPEVLPLNSSLVYGLQNVEGFNSLKPQRYSEFMRVVKERRTMFLEDNPAALNTGLDWLDSKIIDMLNVKYLLTSPDEKISGHKFLEVYKGADLRIYENRTVMPRAFLVNKVKVERDKMAIFKNIKDPSFDPAREVILEKMPERELDLEHSLEGSSVEILDYRLNQVNLTAKLTGDAMLVLGDTMYPGWEVLVDGEKDEIYTANYILRAVPLKKGLHRLKFIYNPGSLKLGLLISLTLLAVIVLGIIWRIIFHKGRLPNFSMALFLQKVK